MRSALAALLLLVATPALADGLPYNPPQIGTISHYLMDGDRRYSEEVTAIEGDRVQIDNMVWLFRSVLPIGESGVTLDEAALAAFWPLTPGESLTLPASWNKETGTVTLTVGDFEQISVAAGSFETLSLAVAVEGDTRLAYRMWLDRSNHMPVLIELQPSDGPALRTALTERQLP